MAGRSAFLILALLHVGGLAASAQTGRAAPNLAAIPPSVRAEIDRLASDEPGQRVTAAESLGQMGGRAVAALPWLYATLDDGRTVYSLVFGFGRTTMWFVTARALAAIGKPAVDFMAKQLSDPRQRPIKGYVLHALGTMLMPEALDLLLTQVDTISPMKPADGSMAQVTSALGCYILDARVPDALLRLAEAAERTGPSFNDALRTFDRFFGSAPASDKEFNTVDAARAWWKANASTAQPNLLARDRDTCPDTR